VHREALPTLNAPPDELRVLVENLVANAIKFRSDQPPEIRIGASKDEAAGKWCINVSDNGIGIDAQHSRKIFDLFQRLHPREKYPGSGVGLAICRKIVEGLGGSIWVEARPEGGSNFRFTLPA